MLVTATDPAGVLTDAAGGGIELFVPDLSPGIDIRFGEPGRPDEDEFEALGELSHIFVLSNTSDEPVQQVLMLQATDGRGNVASLTVTVNRPAPLWGALSHEY